MKKFNNLGILGICWNIIILLLLFFQTNILIAILKERLFPQMHFIKPLLEGDFIAFIKMRAISATVIIVILIIVELIVFFMINRQLARRFKSNKDSETNEKYTIKLQKYYASLSKYLIISIILCIAILAFSSFNIYQHAASIDFSENNATIQSIKSLVLNIEIEKLADMEKFIDAAIVQIKSDSVIYQFCIAILNAFDLMYYFKEIWFLLTYIILGYGIYLNVRMYQHSKQPLIENKGATDEN